MKIGVSSPAFALKPFLNTLDLVSQSFSHWEIIADLDQLLPTIINEFKQSIPSYDIEISIHAPFNDLNIAALNPKLRSIAIDYIKKTIIAANELDIGPISFHPGHYCPSGIYYRDKVQEVNLSSIRELAEFSEEYNATLALENMPIKHWTLGNTADEILEMINDTQLGICFDVGHAFIIGEIEHFLNNIERINNVHIHDNNGRRDEHLIIGHGAIPIPHIIKRLKERYNGDLIIECNNIEEGIESLENLQNILKEA